MEKTVVVVGGSNLDICAKCISPMINKDSNIGNVEFGVGGVGRNIAEFMSLMGCETSLLTAVSDNGFGHVIMDNADQQGITMLLPPLTETKRQTGVYVYIINSNGEFMVGVNEMDITEEITPEVVDGCINSLYFADCVVLEANLPEKTIEHICSFPFKLIADSVSTVKCCRLSHVLDKLYLLKSNFAEACTLTGADNEDDAAKILVSRGLKRGIITLGKRGAMCFESVSGGIKAYYMENPKDNLIDTSGCGDASLAGFTTALMRDRSMKEALAYAQATANINAHSMASVNRKDISYFAVKDLGKKMLETMEIKEYTL